MRGSTALVVALCALALGACVHDGSRPAANQAFLDMYDRPPARARTAKKRVPAREQAETTATVGSTSAAAEPKPYSPEWFAREREREAREDARIRRAIQICRC